MKKFIAVLLCVVMMAVMVPSFFASAKAVPATGETVVAQEEQAGFFEAIKGFFDLWGGLLKMLLGSEVWSGFGPALKEVLDLVSFGEFFETIGDLWRDIVG